MLTPPAPLATFTCGERTLTPRRAPADVPPSFSEVVAAHGFAPSASDHLVDRLPVGVLVADGAGEIVYANAVAQRLGAAEREALQRATARALLLAEAVREPSLTMPDAGRTARVLEVEVTPVWDARRRIAGAIATVADVTAARRASAWQPLVDALMDL
jgi:hypothetical protein